MPETGGKPFTIRTALLPVNSAMPRQGQPARPAGTQAPLAVPLPPLLLKESARRPPAVLL